MNYLSKIVILNIITIIKLKSFVIIPELLKKNNNETIKFSNNWMDNISVILKANNIIIFIKTLELISWKYYIFVIKEENWIFPNL